MPAVVVTLAVAACSGQTAGNSGSNFDVNGNVGGQGFTAKSGAAQADTLPAAKYSMLIGISDYDSQCAGLNVAHAGGALLVVTIFRTDAEIDAETYTVGATLPDPEPHVQLSRWDANCVLSMQSAATGGTITVHSVSAGSVGADIDVTFPGGAIKGHFVAPVCTATSEEAGTSCGH